MSIPVESASLAPACGKCRSHRVRCDRIQPRCGRCSRLGHDCKYPDKSSATTAYVAYIGDLEAEVARVEDELRAESRSSGADLEEPIEPPDSIITDLFAHPADNTHDDSRMRRLVDELGQVSLSAMTASKGSLSSHNTVLRTLIMSAAAPPDARPVQPAISPGLPTLEIAEQVALRYCSDVLPEMPILPPSEVQRHLHGAYHEHDHYSIFLISMILATTAMSLTPSSVDKACASFHLFGLRSLEATFIAPGESADPLLELEAACLLGHFAYLAGSQHADAWALSGLAIRIAVDLGLHELCDGRRRTALLWSAYILDRKLAVRRSLPLGIPEAAVRTLPPPELSVVPLYRTMSAAYMRTVDPLAALSAASLQQSLHSWEEAYVTTRQPSAQLAEDIGIARSLISSNL